MAFLEDVNTEHEIRILGKKDNDGKQLTPDGLIDGKQLTPDGLIILREPTAEEWGNFEKLRVQFRRGKADTSRGCEARVALFDACVIRVENIETAKGPVTIENVREVIPARIKSAWITEVLENIKAGRAAEEEAAEKD